MARARPAQHGREKSISRLCDECCHLNLDQFDLNATPVQLCVWGSILEKKIHKWGGFLKGVINRICAARNTLENGRPYYALLIHIKSANPAKSYNNIFSKKILHSLKTMSMGSDFPENFHIKQFSHGDGALCFLSVSILGSFDGLVATDFHSPQPLDHRLLDADIDCIVHHLVYRTAGPCYMFPRPKGLENKSNGNEVPLHECASIQFKSLQPGENIQNIKKTNPGAEQEKFSPRTGKDYVDWLWKTQTQPLGKYIAAFAKNHTGGAFYCGVKENNTMNIIDALELSDQWKNEIEKTLQEKISEDMLWVQRDPEDDRGYTVLKPEDIKRGQHFDVGFIPVNDSEGGNHNLCILEVKVASFNGVVFNNHRGPVVYVFEKKEEGREVYRPVPLAAEVWLDKLQQQAWCSRHRKPRHLRCGHYDRCSKCQKVPPQQECCKEFKFCCDSCIAASIQTNMMDS